MLYDLNIPYPSNSYNPPTAHQLINLKNTIVTLYLLGYTHLAINFQIPETVKIPVNSPATANPIDLDRLRRELPATKYPNLKLFSRLTVVVNDPARCQGLTKIQHCFDILAIQPLSEKALQLCTSNLDIDLVSLNFANKLPFFLKHKTVGSAIDKGIKFEICYATVVGGYATDQTVNVQLVKKNFFNNVLQLIRSSRSKGLVVSSGALSPLQARGSLDVLTLLKSVGLDSGRSRACVTITPEKVLVSGRLRGKSYKQTVVIGRGLEGEGVKRKIEDVYRGKRVKR